ncbi:MAG: FMN-binding protein [Deltaproteobacteria bacterium]|nr:FMN-binding protein [Deltaproteobacteria bacterium]
MNERVKSVLFMFAITLVCTAALAAVDLANRERIARNQELKLEKVILSVLGLLPGPDPGAEEIARLYGQRVKELTVGGRRVYLGYRPGGGGVTAVAFPVSGPGFWGPIYGLAAVDPQAVKLVGLAFYQHNETPGLGARITEPWFTKQFQGLHLALPAGNRKFFHLRPPGAAAGPGELDAITGATETSTRLEKFLNQDLEEFLAQTWTNPALQRALHQALKG